jgi:hypothetical protein
MQKFLHKTRWPEYATLVIVSILIFAPVLYLEIYVAQSDFQPHLAWAMDLIQHPQNVPPSVISHGLWHWLTLFARQIFDSSWNFAALLVTLLGMAATSGILYYFLRKTLDALPAGLIAIGLQIVTPALLMDYDNILLALLNGYIAPNVYHNPTILLLKPLAILQFFFSIEALLGHKASRKVILLSALVSMAALYAKPNLVICLLPAAAIFALVRLVKKQPVNWSWLVFGLVLPSLALLIWQFVLTFGPASESRVVFAPLQIMRSLSDTSLIVKLLLSMLFPLVITLLNLKDALKDPRMQLGWLSFLFGAVFTYFFAEVGPQSGAANFIWSGQITLFLLYVSSALFLCDHREILKENHLKRWLTLAVIFLQLYFGAGFYFYVLLKSS